MQAALSRCGVRALHALVCGICIVVLCWHSFQHIIVVQGVFAYFYVGKNDNSDFLMVGICSI